jgi:hypothetical protein
MVCVKLLIPQKRYRGHSPVSGAIGSTSTALSASIKHHPLSSYNFHQSIECRFNLAVLVIILQLPSRFEETGLQNGGDFLRVWLVGDQFGF